MPSSVSILNLKLLRGMRRMKYSITWRFPIIRTKKNRKSWEYRLKREKKLQHWCPAPWRLYLLYKLYIDRTVIPSSSLNLCLPDLVWKTPVKALYWQKEREKDWKLYKKKQIKIKERKKEKKREKFKEDLSSLYVKSFARCYNHLSSLSGLNDRRSAISLG